MEKRSGRGSGLPPTWLVLPLGLCLALGAALSWVEVSRRSEASQLREEIEALAAKLAKLSAQIADTHNTTTRLAAEVSSQGLNGEKKDRPYYDDYDDDYYDEYEDEDEDDQGRRRDEDGRRNRTRRSLQYKYKVHIAKEPKQHNSFRNAGVQARIYVDKDDYQPQISAGTVVRPPPPGVYERKSRVMTTEPTRPFHSAQHPVRHYHEQLYREDHYKKDKSHRAVHFGGDTSHYKHRRRDEIAHYDCNQRMYHPGGAVKDWLQAKWSVPYNGDFILNRTTGHVRVDSPGIYYVYAQLYYNDEADKSGFVINRNEMAELRCTVTVDGRRDKRNTCYTGGLLELQAGDLLSVREVEGTRYVIHERTRSFFGMFKVA